MKFKVVDVQGKKCFFDIKKEAETEETLLFYEKLKNKEWTVLLSLPNEGTHPLGLKAIAQKLNELYTFGIYYFSNSDLVLVVCDEPPNKRHKLMLEKLLRDTLLSL
jgi:hypothetical protein